MNDHQPALAALLARFERGEETLEERATIRRALLAAADGRPVAGILAADARTKRDDALAEMRDAHFAGLPPSRAAKGMAERLARYASAAWAIDRRAPEPPPAGTINRCAFEV